MAVMHQFIASQPQGKSIEEEEEALSANREAAGVFAWLRAEFVILEPLRLLEGETAGGFYGGG